MVAHQILVLTVGVRILRGELRLNIFFCSAFFVSFSDFSEYFLVPSNIGLVRDPLKVERRVRFPLGPFFFIMDAIQQTSKSKIIFSQIFAFVKKEIVLVISILLATISAFFVKPSFEYINYIDFNVLFLLFSFMTVCAGLKECNIFDFCGEFLCSKVKSCRALCGILVFLCFFFSMFITNDVALLTFVPFSILLLSKIKKSELIIYVVVLQTIAANLGSMFTPMGNPQNLFLFSAMQNSSNITFFDFAKILLPYTTVSGILLLLSLLPIKSEKLLNLELSSQTKITSKPKATIFCILFVLCFLTVLKILPSWILTIIILIFTLILNAALLKKVDYLLLLTFCGFFIFSGNIANIPFIKEFLLKITCQREFFVSLITSQIISNVPATLLLYPFCSNVKQLLLGVNIGGLGTIIASLASLISFKLYSKGVENSKTLEFFKIFTLCNILFLAVLLAVYLVLG